MSGTYPTSPEFASLNVTSRHNNVKTETRSGRVQVRSIGAQRWELTAQYRLMTREQMQPIIAFIMAQQGSLETFQIQLPVHDDALGNVSGTVRANGAHAIGDSTITIDGITGTLKAGDFIKFANHTKVYMVTADRSGAGTLSIQPGLLSAVPDNTVITYDNVQFTVRLANDVQEMRVRGYEQYNYEVDLIEVI